MDVPVAIVGGGAMGLSAAWALGKRGVACAVLDPLPRRTERNASNDESKVFRVAYAQRDDYSRLALQALDGWRALERAAHVRVLHPHGVLSVGRDGSSFALRSLDTLQRLGRAPKEFDAGTLDEAHPALAGAGFEHGVLDRDGGMLDPPVLLEALETEAIAHRARVFRERQVVALERDAGQTVCVLEHGRVRARVVIVAAGHRAPSLLPELEPFLRCTRQPEFAFSPAAPERFRPDRLPVFAAFEDGFYGFPLHRGAVKVADHRKGAEQPPEPSFDPPSAAEEQSLRGLLQRGMPTLADAPLARSRICHYDNTPDDDFLLGRHPQRDGVLLAVGFSGHGMKFAPAVGEALADMALVGEADKDWARCDPARYLG